MANMSNEKNWLHVVFSKDELRELTQKSDRILFDQENGLVVNLELTNNQCMELVHHYRITLSDVDDAMPSYIYLDDFLSHFISFLEKHLDTEVPNWNEIFNAKQLNDYDWPDED